MSRKPFLMVAITGFVFSFLISAKPAAAQSAVLAEMYGRGVHAYYAGRHDEAYQYLSMAIDNGSRDPRAYYFRGLVANSQGRPDEAEADWSQGAKIEAESGASPAVGRALARFQGTERLKLEEIRQQARLEAMAIAAARSRQRYGEIEAAGEAGTPNVNRSTPVPGAAASQPPRSATPPAAAASANAPPASSPADNPFQDDLDLDMGEPTVESSDAFADAINNDAIRAAETAGGEPAAGAPAGGGIFGDEGGAAAKDPFGGDDAGSDPFGAGAGMADDPFGDPF